MKDKELIDKLQKENKRLREKANYWPKGKVMVCDRGRSEGMRLFPDCTWEGGAECSGLEPHKYNPETCGRRFCMRAGVWRQCTDGSLTQEEKQKIDDYFKRLGI